MRKCLLSHLPLGPYPELAFLHLFKRRGLPFEGILQSSPLPLQPCLAGLQGGHGLSKMLPLRFRGPPLGFEPRLAFFKHFHGVKSLGTCIALTQQLSLERRSLRLQPIFRAG